MCSKQAEVAQTGHVQRNAAVSFHVAVQQWLMYLEFNVGLTVILYFQLTFATNEYHLSHTKIKQGIDTKHERKCQSRMKIV